MLIFSFFGDFAQFLRAVLVNILILFVNLS